MRAAGSSSGLGSRRNVRPCAASCRALSDRRGVAGPAHDQGRAGGGARNHRDPVRRAFSVAQGQHQARAASLGIARSMDSDGQAAAGPSDAARAKVLRALLLLRPRAGGCGRRSRRSAQCRRHGPLRPLPDCGPGSRPRATAWSGLSACCEDRRARARPAPTVLSGTSTGGRRSAAGRSPAAGLRLPKRQRLGDRPFPVAQFVTGIGTCVLRRLEQICVGRESLVLGPDPEGPRDLVVIRSCLDPHAEEETWEDPPREPALESGSSIVRRRALDGQGGGVSAGGM